MKWQPSIKLTLECEAIDLNSSRKLWVQASPCAWPRLFELLAAEGLHMTGSWRVLQEQWDRCHGYSRVAARGYTMTCESMQLLSA
jgi:hypothetical protein|nr:MAG TPA: hypothetical protein [Caudoviricetes sp.]